MFQDPKNKTTLARRGCHEVLNSEIDITLVFQNHPVIPTECEDRCEFGPPKGRTHLRRCERGSIHTDPHKVFGRLGSLIFMK